MCTNVDDLWKLGLVYFVDGVLLTHERKTSIDRNLLSLVEDEESFFKYPWGKESYKKTFGSLKKDMGRIRELWRRSHDNKRKQVEAKYTVYGFPLAFQCWAYEAIPVLALNWAEMRKLEFPRMLCWSATKTPTAKDVLDIFTRKNVSVLFYELLHLHVSFFCFMIEY